MSEWKKYKLGDAPIEIIDGDRGSNYPKLNELLDVGDVPFLNSSAIENFELNYNKIKFITNEKAEKIKKGKVIDGDVVLTTRGNGIGKLFKFDKDKYRTAVINAQMLILRADSKRLISEFLYQLLKSKRIQEDLYNNASGSAQPQLPIFSLKEIIVPIPSVNEQIRISNILESLDDKIYLLNTQNKTLENIFDILFNKYFLGVETNNLNKIRLNEIADFQNGLPCQKYPRKGNELGLPVVKIKEMKNGITDTSDSVTENIPEDYIINDGDVLFSWSGSLDIAVWCGGKAVLNQHLFKVTSQKYPRWFFYAWIKHHLPKFKIIAESKTTTMGHIQKSDLTDSIVFVPENEEFVRIDKIMGNLFEKIHFNKHSTKNLKNLLQLLISLFFTNK